jgi:carboxylesterase type B
LAKTNDEDLLIISSMLPRDLVVSKSRPVIVWIHGGNFGRGSASEYEPDYILDHEVVLVTIQYR